MTARSDGGRSVTDRLERRRFLAGAGGVLVALAGCTQSDDGGDGTDRSTAADKKTPTGGTRATGETDAPGGTTEQSTEADGQVTPTDRGTTMNETTENDELDLREANVVEVAFDRRDGTVQFDVTLYHDDDGEAEYANWWQVETLDVPEGVTCVVVRGHDQIHEYGGQAAIVNLESGETNLVRQGSGPQSLAQSGCP